MTDWGAGQYERTAVVLAPAAEQAVAVLAPAAGERVIDVACGTGNAALLAAAAGADVVGVDLAERLVEAAVERARAAGLPERASFSVANAETLPFADDSFDAAVSVFGVIFADPDRAVPELLRVVRPGARIVVTSWVPVGGMFAAVNVLREALGAPPRLDRWARTEDIESLFAPHDASITEHTLTTRSKSLDAYLDEQLEHHPMWIEARQALTTAGTLDDVRQRMRAAYEQANESQDAFAVTSRYLITVVTVAER